MRVGVVGAAGTMGAGIVALSRDVAGFETVAVDLGDDLLALDGCDLVIEAIVEDAEAKRALLAQLPGGAVLASNTSSIPITSLAAAAPDPSRVVGLHFFNPPGKMRLVELVRGLQSGAEAVAVGRTAAEAMGRTVVEVADGPGFLVNRCNRPFGLEAAKLVQERLATPEQVDQVVRAAGFPMGPFELADLVGLDTGLAVQESFFALGYGEPRWQPSRLTAQLVAAGRLGRKTGHGWHAYPRERPAVAAPPFGGGDGRLVVIAGDLAVAHGLRALADDAGWDVAEEAEGDVPFLLVDAGHEPGEALPLQGAPQALLCAEASLHQLDPGGGAVGFHLLPGAGIAELTRGPGSTDAAADRTAAFFATLGLASVWVGDAPGLVLGRLAAQLVNEAAFALGEGVVEDPALLDRAMELGLNHPRGPLAWGDAIGLEHVLAVLDGLRAERGEERYRAAPVLRAMVAAGRLGEHVGGGFHDGPHEDDDLVV